MGYCEHKYKETYKVNNREPKNFEKLGKPNMIFDTVSIDVAKAMIVQDKTLVRKVSNIINSVWYQNNKSTEYGLKINELSTFIRENKLYK